MTIAPTTTTRIGGAVWHRRRRRKEVEPRDIGGEGHLHRLLVTPTLLQDMSPNINDDKLSPEHVTELRCSKLSGRILNVASNITSGEVQTNWCTSRQH